MHTATLSRPSQLHLCSAQPPRLERAPWSTGSDSDDDEATSADSSEYPEVDRDDEPSFDGPSTSPAQRMLLRRGAEPLPTLSVRPRTATRSSSPRSSPLSPLAACADDDTPVPAPALAAAAPRPRPRGLGMSPIAATGRPGLPKATPLARTLLNRTVGTPATVPKKTTKFIVPTKPFRATFELGLTSTELARK